MSEEPEKVTIKEAFVLQTQKEHEEPDEHEEQAVQEVLVHQTQAEPQESVELAKDKTLVLLT